MAKKTISQEIRKTSYEKPLLLKHGSLKDVTAASGLGSVKNEADLGCTRF